MQTKNYTFRFHNPNTAEDTANFFLSLVMKAASPKIEEEILHTLEKEKTRRKSAQKSTTVSAPF